MIKALRANHITYELFEVARIFLEKSERYVASITRKAAEGERAEQVAVAIPDGMPFETEEEAIQHVVSNDVETFFDQEKIETEPPSGNFPFVNRCGLTKKILGPPNYHRYEEFVSQHFQTQISNASFERFQSQIVQDREEEAVNEWRESMKKTVRYSTKSEDGETAETFDTLKEAIVYLRTTQRDKMVKTVNYARVSGVTLDKFPNTEASRAVSGELARQQRFPLKTANLIRGRLRREKFSIYKRGSKGVTYICAAKRNFRKPGQVMSDSLDRLIHYVELNANVKVKELPSQYEAWLKEKHPDSDYEEKKLFQDLHWLIADGYITHFADDSLVAQPVLDENSGEENVAKERQRKPEKPKADSKYEPVRDVVLEDAAKKIGELSEEPKPEVENSVEGASGGEETVNAPEAPVGEAANEIEEASKQTEPEAEDVPEAESAASESELSADVTTAGGVEVGKGADENVEPVTDAEKSEIDSPESMDTEDEIEKQEAAIEDVVELKTEEAEKIPESAGPSTSESETDVEAAKAKS
tara:strand:- start:723 stop:2312 length:1590 start_codon:yes stop_codon:yes gene_type:complete